MKKLATLTAAAALMLGLAGPAQAGGMSDTSFEGDWCVLVYGPDQFDPQLKTDNASVLVIGSSAEVVLGVSDSQEKYVGAAAENRLLIAAMGTVAGTEVEACEPDKASPCASNTCNFL